MVDLYVGDGCNVQRFAVDLNVAVGCNVQTFVVGVLNVGSFAVGS